MLLLFPNFSKGQFAITYDSLNYRILVFANEKNLEPIDSIPILIGSLKDFQLKDSTLYFLTEAYTMQGEKTYVIYCCALNLSKGYTINYHYFVKSKEISPHEYNVHINESGLSFEIDKSSLSINISFSKLDKAQIHQNITSFIQGVADLNAKLLK